MFAINIYDFMSQFTSTEKQAHPSKNSGTMNLFQIIETGESPKAELS